MIHRDQHLRGIGLQPEFGAFGNLNFLCFGGDREFVVTFAMDIEVGIALRHIHGSRFCAGIAQGKLSEIQDCVGDKANYAAIFKLNLGASAIASAQAGAIGDRHVEEGLAKFVAIAAIELHVTIYVTEPNHAGVRVSLRGRSPEAEPQKQRQCGNNEDQPRTQHIKLL